MAQAVEESQSLYRIKNDYLNDSKECDECTEFWKKLIEDKEQHCDDLWNLIKNHMKE